MAEADENERTGGGASLATDSFTLYSFMDEVESRVETLRRQASSLIGEQASLLLIIDQLKNDCLGCDISSEDCQELMAHMERLKVRCEAVEMQVHTVRDEGQRQSLQKVNDMLQDLHTRFLTNAHGEGVPAKMIQQARTYLNACLPEAIGAIDTRFQSLVLGCAIDDQKEVRRRLESLMRDYGTFRSSSPKPGRETDRMDALGVSAEQSDSNNSSESTDFVYVKAGAQSQDPSQASHTQSSQSKDTESKQNVVEASDDVDNFCTDRFFEHPKDSCKGNDLQVSQQAGETIQQVHDKGNHNT